MTDPFGLVCIGSIPMCKHCGKPLCVADAGPHYCPGSWAEARRARIADAVELLVSEGYVVMPPESEASATPAEGVCVGDHVAASPAGGSAGEIERLRDLNALLREALDGRAALVSDLASQRNTLACEAARLRAERDAARGALEQYVHEEPGIVGSYRWTVRYPTGRCSYHKTKASAMISLRAILGLDEALVEESEGAP